MGPLSQCPNKGGYDVFELPSVYYLIPGYIDVHIHGVNGADTMDATPEALAIMAETLPQEGTTSFLATTITQEIEKALVNTGECIESQQISGKAEVLGIHLEGPFINKEMGGAQPINHIIRPEPSLFQRWQVLSKNTIKLVTLAPEVDGAMEMISFLCENGEIASSDKDADLVLLDENHDPEMTFCRGEIAYQKEGLILNGDYNHRR